jgi:hypothetical protein
MLQNHKLSPNTEYGAKYWTVGPTLYVPPESVWLNYISLNLYVSN